VQRIRQCVIANKGNKQVDNLKQSMLVAKENFLSIKSLYASGAATKEEVLIKAKKYWDAQTEYFCFA
jgi:hypothetical protein